MNNTTRLARLRHWREILHDAQTCIDQGNYNAFDMSIWFSIPPDRLSREKLTQKKVEQAVHEIHDNQFKCGAAACALINASHVILGVDE